MRKILFFTLILVFFISACNASEPETAVPTEIDYLATAQQEAQVTAAAGPVETQAPNEAPQATELPTEATLPNPACEGLSPIQCLHVGTHIYQLVEEIETEACNDNQQVSEVTNTNEFEGGLASVNGQLFGKIGPDMYLQPDPGVAQERVIKFSETGYEFWIYDVSSGERQDCHYSIYKFWK